MFTEAPNEIDALVDDAISETQQQQHLPGGGQQYQRPSITVNDRQLRLIVDDALKAIIDVHQKRPAKPLVFVQGSNLARITIDKRGAGFVDTYTPDSMRWTLTNVADWIKFHEDDGKGKPDRIENVDPPIDVAKTLLAMGGWNDIPEIEGVTSCPTFAPNGTLHNEEGYSEATKLYYVRPVATGDITPTKRNVEKAVSLIKDDLLVDFPFGDDASRAHAIALLLLPFVRPMINGAIPMHLIDAPEAGTGKGLLADLCGIVATGEALAATSPGTNEDEWRKKITSLLMTGGSHIAFDNLSQSAEFGSAALATALTQEYWSDRILGLSKEFRSRIRCIWVASGNNVKPSKEIARRCTWIRLDANLENPQNRQTFKHSEIREWAKLHRSELVTACLTIVSHWLAEGKPLAAKRKGSFEAWAAIMGGILESIKINGLLGNDAQLMDTAANEQAILRAFVEAWATHHQENEVESARLFALASFPDDSSRAPFPLSDYLGLLDELLGNGKEQGRKTKLGNLLSTNRDRVIVGYKIRQCKTVAGKPRWRLEKL